jgi:hypothetical protein
MLDENRKILNKIGDKGINYSLTKKSREFWQALFNRIIKFDDVIKEIHVHRSNGVVLIFYNMKSSVFCQSEVHYTPFHFDYDQLKPLNVFMISDKMSFYIIEQLSRLRGD